MDEIRAFISHSTHNKKVAEYLTEFLQAIGIKEVFCSSVPETGVSEVISLEVKKAISNSLVDIIVLSPEYMKSRYCLNEAGIIWYKDSATRIIVGVSDHVSELSAGFINADYLHLDLSSEKFVDEFIKRIKNSCENALNTINFNLRVLNELEEKRICCVSHLPLIKNLRFSGGESITGLTSPSLDIVSDSLAKCKKLVKNYDSAFSSASYFYQRYVRSIIIGAAERSDYIAVKTFTELTAVNLSDENHAEKFSSQFLKTNGGIDRFKVVRLEQDGHDCSDTYQDLHRPKDLSHSVYVHSPVITLYVHPHTISNIFYETVYEIPIELFFQSKVINVPCSEYEVHACFDESFNKSFDNDYIFRYQLIPPDEDRLDARLTRQAEIDKHVVNQRFANGMCAGGGYALAISKIF